MQALLYTLFKKQLPVISGVITLLAFLTAPPFVYAANPDSQIQTLKVLVANTAAQSGLIDTLARAFEALNPSIRIEINTGGAVAVIDKARQGGVGLVITHHAASEILFMDEGYGVVRTLLMYNQFALFGPPGMMQAPFWSGSLLDVLRKLARDEVPFMVPGVSSGTQMKLAELWSLAGVKSNWPGYEITGSSSEATLRQAAIFGAYAFADIATYLANRENLSPKLVPIYRDHSALRNYYSVIVVNGARFSHETQQVLAEAFLDFLVSYRGQSIIKTFGEDEFDFPLYTPAAHLDPGLQSRQIRIALEMKKQNLELMTGLAILFGIFSLMASWLFIRSRKIQHQVLHDSLTGLPNRVLLSDRLEQSIRLAARTNHPFALLMIDLNGFKAINDTYGHHAGDEVLVCVAQRLMHILRKSDTVARLGGDEFAVLLTDAGAAYANQLAQKIIFSMKKAVELSECRLYVGASIGISVYPQHGDDIHTLVKHADAAMYVAKRGNSGVATYSGVEILHQPVGDRRI